MIKYFLVAEQQCSLMVLVMVDAGVGRGLRYADLIAVECYSKLWSCSSSRKASHEWLAIL